MIEAPPVVGLLVRPFDRNRDVPALAALIVQAHLEDEIDWLPTEENLANDLDHRAHFDPALDLVVAELDERMVAASETVVQVRDGEANHRVGGWVAPDQRRRGIARALLHWSQARSRAAAAAWSGSEPHVLSSWVDEGQPGAIALLEQEDYARIRYGFMMIRTLADPVPDLPLPEGLAIRPVVEVEHRQIWDADCEAFQDHWGALERTEKDYEHWFATPELDTSLWRVAWAGDEVAGSVMNFIYPAENERLGVSRVWLDHISVRRPWRRRGLAAAPIADSLRAFTDVGLEDAALGVDAENLSGALRLYESLGFRRHRTGITFRKVM